MTLATHPRISAKNARKTYCADLTREVMERIGTYACLNNFYHDDGKRGWLDGILEGPLQIISKFKKIEDGN
jgi:hypothetical protein